MKAIRLLLAVSLVSMLAACATTDNATTEEQSADITATEETTTTGESQSYTMDDVTTEQDAISDVSAGTQVDETVKQDTSLGASSSGLGR
jgi:hypothetical protein